MEIITEILRYPFMQRALVAGLALGILTAVLGVFVMLRRMAFFSEGIAHASLAGLMPLPFAILWALLVALFIYWFEHSTKLTTDTLIGIFFSSSMALGVLLMSFTQGYQPEIFSYLFGSILAISQIDLWVILALSLVILVWIFSSLRPLTYMSLNKDSASVAGVKT